MALVIFDPALPYEAWEELGRALGAMARTNRWWLGDWLLAGEDLYGEEASQALESRYEQGERVTGLAYETLTNYAWVCRQVPPERRRPSLSFSAHAEVASLEPDEQERWLSLAEEQGWSSAELRRALRAERARAESEAPEREEASAGGRPRAMDELREAAQAVWAAAQLVEDHYRVPLEPMARLGAVLGE
ncbi:MAG: LmbU family transcriptional regulator [Armatimonadota bacterium]|nr:LmbU family transcriptional regulator [Armatimonadota bacterium]